MRYYVADLHKIRNSFKSCLSERVFYVQRLREGLKVKFRKEYLSMLVHRSESRKHDVNSVNVGDIVLIGEDIVNKKINSLFCFLVKMGYRE